jgi:hypothetical protein
MESDRTVLAGQVSAPGATEKARPGDEIEIDVAFEDPPEAAPPIAPRAAEASVTSLRPVGIEVSQRAETSGELPAALPSSPRAPRRRLTWVVYGCVGGSLLLLAAGGARFARKHAPGLRPPQSLPAAAAQGPASIASPTGAPAVTRPNTDVTYEWANTFPGVEAAPREAPKGAGAAASQASVDTPPATGTLVLRRPALPANVWLDGARLRAASTRVPCGTHEIRVGARGHSREIDVPCGGELTVSR